MLDLEELEQKATEILLHRFPAKRNELLDSLATASIMNLPDPYHEFMKWMSPPASTKKRKKTDTDIFEPSSESLYPTNAILKSLVTLVAKELLLFMEMCNTLKLWLLMTLPKIEEGNQFEVNLREDMIKELSRAEDDAFSILDSTSQFHIARGKIVSKIIKYPNIEDYHLATLQTDMKQYHQLRLTLRDLANNYAVLNDLLTKNLEQLKIPKEHATVDIIS